MNEKINIPKDFVLKKVIQETGWHRDKNDIFQSLNTELKNSNTFYKTKIIDGKLRQLSITIGEIKQIIEAHSHVLKCVTNGWYEKNQRGQRVNENKRLKI